MIFLFYFFKILFIYFWREGKGGRKRGRETSMCERNINVWLPLARPQLGTWPTTQACALIGNRTSDLSFGLQAGAQSTEPLQPRWVDDPLNAVWSTNPGFFPPWLVCSQRVIIQRKPVVRSHFCGFPFLHMASTVTLNKTPNPQTAWANIYVSQLVS